MNTPILPYPQEVWKHFDALCQVPRPSSHEEQIRAFLRQFAHDRQLECVQDEAGNVLIRKPGNSEPVILQAHQDMVCEKHKHVEHDFMTDPIRWEQQGDWVSAQGTTLGADDGIGMAMMLTMLDGNYTDHALECLFTASEEIGLLGAAGLQPGTLQGKQMINLDTEWDEEIIIGCAGGCDTLLRFEKQTSPLPENYFAARLHVYGLMGGHSGEDIEKPRANANKLLIAFIAQELSRTDLKLAHIDGGGLRNAIPREAEAVVAVPWEYKEQLRVDWNIYTDSVEEQWKTHEPGIKLLLGSIACPKEGLTDELTQRIVTALMQCPHGVLAFYKEMPDLVDLSTNLASIHTEENSINICTSQRCADSQRKMQVSDEIVRIFAAQGATAKVETAYEGWIPNPKDAWVTHAAAAYTRLFGKRPRIKAIHAGLECGLFLQSHPGLEIISIGPTMQGVHSPHERVSIASVAKIWQFLLELLH